MPPDARFARGLIHRVAVSRDANLAGTSVSPLAGVAPDWRPVPGQGSVPCRLIPDADAERDDQDKRAARVRYKVLFGADPGLGQGDLLLFLDAAGREHRLFVQGQPRDAHHMGHHWVASAAEYVD